MSSVAFSLPTQQDVQTRALLLGARIDMKPLRAEHPLALNPLTLACPGGGCAVLFRYGAIVFFGVEPDDQRVLLQQLTPLVTQPLERPEEEALTLHIDPTGREGIDGQGRLWVADGTVSRLQLIAEVLAKSVLLAENESRLADTFDRIEPLAERLRAGQGGVRQQRDLLRYIGDSLVSLQRMVGRAAVGEKPDLLWEHPNLERFYLRLEDEYEVRERQIALERKLEVISSTAETLLDLLQAQRSLRVEWYIVALILVEICLTLYELFIRGH